MAKQSNGSEKKILIVEDEKLLAHALEIKLNNANFQTRLVFDGQAALEALGQESFNLVILDLILPKLDGFGVLKELQKDKNFTTPIIVTSNLSQVDDRQRVKELGALSYFVKSDTPVTQIIAYIIKTLET